MAFIMASVGVVFPTAPAAASSSAAGVHPMGAPPAPLGGFPAPQARQGQGRHRGQGTGQVAIQEVLLAVESLYNDQLRPYGRILRKRLSERARSAGRRLGNISFDSLRQTCGMCPWLQVVPEEGGDWSALFTSRPAYFVDVHSPVDTYPPQMWREAEAYFDSLNAAEKALPGGRYECAQALTSRRVSFVVGRSLGQVCHIVQLAISARKLLGYLNGKIVPYRLSQSMAKAQCAIDQRPFANASAAEGEGVAGWDDLASGVGQLLGELPSQDDSIPLSNVKRLFLLRYGLDLSETALGYAKLSEMLQDARLRDICAVRLQHNGYVVVRPRAGGRQTTISISELLAARPAPAPAAARRGAAPRPQGVVGGAAPAASSSSSGRGGGGARQEAGAALRSRASNILPLTLEESDGAEAPPESEPTPQPAAWGPSPPQRSGASTDSPGMPSSSFDGLPSPTSTPMLLPRTPALLVPPTPSPWSPCGRGGTPAPGGGERLPMLLGHHRVRDVPQRLGAGGKDDQANRDGTDPAWDPGVPVATSLVAVRASAMASPPTERLSKNLEDLGYRVQNTFIDAVELPTSPAVPRITRSKSMHM